jgi:hypothetical protein
MRTEATKPLVFSIILLSILSINCGAVFVQNPLSSMDFDKSAGTYQVGSNTFNLFSLFQKATTPNLFPDTLQNNVISKAEAISIAKAYCGMSITLQTTAKLQWVYSMNAPDAPVWEVTVKGREKNSAGMYSLITHTVKINGYTGRVISVN